MNPPVFGSLLDTIMRRVISEAIGFKSLGAASRVKIMSSLRRRYNEISLGSWIGSFWNPKEGWQSPRLTNRIPPQFVLQPTIIQQKGKSVFEFTVFNRKHDGRRSKPQRIWRKFFATMILLCLLVICHERERSRAVVKPELISIQCAVREEDIGLSGKRILVNNSNNAPENEKLKWEHYERYSNANGHDCYCDFETRYSED